MFSGPTTSKGHMSMFFSQDHQHKLFGAVYPGVEDDSMDQDQDQESMTTGVIQVTTPLNTKSGSDEIVTDDSTRYNNDNDNDSTRYDNNTMTNGAWNGNDTSTNGIWNK